MFMGLNTQRTNHSGIQTLTGPKIWGSEAKESDPSVVLTLEFQTLEGEDLLQLLM